MPSSPQSLLVKPNSNNYQTSATTQQVWCTGIFSSVGVGLGEQIFRQTGYTQVPVPSWYTSTIAEVAGLCFCENTQSSWRDWGDWRRCLSSGRNQTSLSSSRRAKRIQVTSLNLAVTELLHNIFVCSAILGLYVCNPHLV